MTSRAVHWHNEMFLRPLHFQAAHRYCIDQMRRNHNWDVHYNWGLRSIEIDPTALANHRLVIRSLEARLRDGTPVVLPRDGVLPELNLRTHFQSNKSRVLRIYLAVPAIFAGRSNVALERNPKVRYYQESMEVEDESTGGDPQTIAVRALNIQILVGNQDQTGYQVLPIAQIERTDRADGGLQHDVSFIPPLMSCDAWKPLADGILGSLQDRLDKKIDWLAEHIARQGITFDRQMPGDVLVLKQLQQLSESSSVLGVLHSSPGIHPLTAFLELSRIVGQVAIFGATRRPPEFPRYDHDDLGTCFAFIKQHLDAQLNLVVEPEYKERQFIGAGWRMQVGLEPSWLSASSQIYIGVQSTLDPVQCVNMLADAGQLDMKVGSSDRVEELFRKGAAGLRFEAEELPPQELPKVAGQMYFRLIQDTKDPEWLNLKKSLTLALRLNENLIVGSIQNQRRLTIRVDGRNVAMQFSLFVLSSPVVRSP
ncbi:MAG: type VI secretion system baseplate subunit TssK [Gemmataceae bacterium]|nr:type VI secretion system baseplate subunit TssK [Gemmataceae bacterium]